MGAVFLRRYPCLHRPRSTNALLVGHQAPDQRNFCKPRGLAGKQPDVAKHAKQLSGDAALPPALNTEVSSSCGGGGSLEARPSSEVARRDESIPSGGPNPI